MCQMLPKSEWCLHCWSEHNSLLGAETFAQTNIPPKLANWKMNYICCYSEPNILLCKNWKRNAKETEDGYVKEIPQEKAFSYVLTFLLKREWPVVCGCKNKTELPDVWQQARSSTRLIIEKNVEIRNNCTFFTRSKSPPVAKVSLPRSSTVTAESFESTRPAAKGWPGLLQETSHGILICIRNENAPNRIELPLYVFVSDMNIADR